MTVAELITLLEAYHEDWEIDVYDIAAHEMYRYITIYSDNRGVVTLEITQ